MNEISCDSEDESLVEESDVDKIDNDNEDANCCENDSELQSVLAYADFMNRLAYVDNVPEKITS